MHPAVVEAHHARVPLIVCTADRPPELHHTGAPQTIEQIGLFATATRWAYTPGVPTEGQEDTWRPLAVRAFEEAFHGANGPGPVHLNLEFREPLTGTPAPLPERQARKWSSLSRAGWPATRTTHLELEPLQGRGLIIVGGPWPQRADPARVRELADRLGWPVLADPLSGSRLEGTIAAADAIVRTEPPPPERIVLLGAPWLSGRWAQYVSVAARAGARIIVVDPWRQWADPSRWRPSSISAVRRMAGLRRRSGTRRAIRSGSTRGAHVEGAGRHRRRAREPISVSRSWPARSTASAETGRHSRGGGVHADPGPRVVSPRLTGRRLGSCSNRGVNGIDGVVSTALGVAESGSGQSGRTIALLGDLTFLHDVSGLVNLPELPCTFVVLDNGGGGIFSFLPQAASVEPAVFEELFGTPPTSDIGAVARGFGLPVHEVTALSQLEVALATPTPTPSLVRVMVPGRPQNVALHDAINQAVRLSLQ